MPRWQGYKIKSEWTSAVELNGHFSHYPPHSEIPHHFSLNFKQPWIYHLGAFIHADLCQWPVSETNDDESF